LEDSICRTLWQIRISSEQSFERQFERDDRKNLVALYVHDDDLEKAFAELKDRTDLSLVCQYRDPVAATAPVEYFADFLKDKHSNRPAFLDELEKAGF